VPIRRPDDTIDGQGSNRTAMRLTVISVWGSRSPACWPLSSELRRSTAYRLC
jgi:hypothetical protein